MQQLIPLLDLIFLLIERPDVPSNVGLLTLFEPPTGTSARRAVQAAVRHYRAAQPSAPFDRIPALAPLPHWVQAPRADPRWHVRYETLAPPGAARQLWDRVAAIHQRPLDRARPLFEVHFIDGLADGRFAMYFKSHHATWDGRSAFPRVFGALSQAPGALLPPFYASQPQPAYSGDATPPGDTLAGLRRLLSEAGAAGQLTRPLVTRLQHAAAPERGARLANAPFAGPRTRFNGPLCGERSTGGFSLPLGQMRRVAAACDSTLNDVVLTVVDAGLQRYLATRGETPQEPLVAMCPVSQREPGDLTPTVKVTTLFVRLGRPRARIGARIREIVASTRAAKQELGALSKAAARDYAMLAFGAWGAARLLGLEAVMPPVINFVVSNVGGEPGPRYLGRSRVVAAYPVSMISDPTRLNLSVLSSDGRMDFGIVADRAAVPDAAEIADECVAAFAQLRRSATRRRRLSA